MKSIVTLAAFNAAALATFTPALKPFSATAVSISMTHRPSDTAVLLNQTLVGDEKCYQDGRSCWRAYGACCGVCRREKSFLDRFMCYPKDTKDDRACLANGEDCSGKWGSCCSGACYMDKSRGSHSCFKRDNDCAKNGACVEMIAASTEVKAIDMADELVVDTISSIEAAAASAKHADTAASTNFRTTLDVIKVETPGVFAEAIPSLNTRQCLLTNAQCSMWKNKCCSGNCWRDWTRGGRHTCA